MQLASVRIRVPRNAPCSRSTKLYANRYLFACGGSGGHVFPAIAIAKQVAKADPDAEILFFGSKDRLESRVVPEHGFEWRSVPTATLARPVYLPVNFINVFKAAFATLAALIHLRKFKPDVVLGTGGFVAFAPCVAAAICRIPFYIVEPNVLPGVVNRTLIGWARAAFTSFKVPEFWFPKEKVLRVGVPIRDEFESVRREDARRDLGLSQSDLLLTVVGGSLGALQISRTIRNITPTLLSTFPNLRIHHQTGLSNTVPLAVAAQIEAPTPRDSGPKGKGKKKIEEDEEEYEEDEEDKAIAAAALADKRLEAEAKESLARTPVRQYREMPFFNEMAQQLAASDLVLARSGAITCAEMLATGTPSVLIPLAIAADSHQYFNAISMEAVGAAVAITESQFEEEYEDSELIMDDAAFKAKRAREMQQKALETLLQVLGDAERRAELARAARDHGRCTAATVIAQALVATARDPKAEIEVLKPYRQTGVLEEATEAAVLQPTPA